jgi:EKC/KEOPS complex subunit CGI121/TPRKB
LLEHDTDPSQIADAIKRFGISASTKTLLLVKIGRPAGAVGQETNGEVETYQQRLVDRMSDLVEGEMVPLSALPTTSDWKAIKKVRSHPPHF